MKRHPPRSGVIGGIGAVQIERSGQHVGRRAPTGEVLIEVLIGLREGVINVPESALLGLRQDELGLRGVEGLIAPVLDIGNRLQEVLLRELVALGRVISWTLAKIAG